MCGEAVEGWIRFRGERVDGGEHKVEGEFAKSYRSRGDWTRIEEVCEDDSQRRYWLLRAVAGAVEPGALDVGCWDAHCRVRSRENGIPCFKRSAGVDGWIRRSFRSTSQCREHHVPLQPLPRTPLQPKQELYPSRSA